MTTNNHTSLYTVWFCVPKSTVVRFEEWLSMNNMNTKKCLYFFVSLAVNFKKMNFRWFLHCKRLDFALYNFDFFILSCVLGWKINNQSRSHTQVRMFYPVKKMKSCKQVQWFCLCFVLSDAVWVSNRYW